MNSTEFSEKSMTTGRDQNMQAAVLSGPQNFEFKSMELPEPSADEVRIRIEGCGLCASNLPVWEGREWFSYPLEPGAPGHEGWGTIDAVGKNVERVKPGDRVAALSHHAFADYDITHRDHVVPLPENLSGKPFPGEPLGCAVNIFRRSKIEPGMTVAIIGIGFLGSLLVELAKQAGAEVIALSRRDSSLKLAEHYGADHIWSLQKDSEIVERAASLTDGNLCDCVIEATGKQEPLNLAAQLTGIRGRLIIAGYHQGEKRSVDMQLWNWRGLDVINAHEREPEVYISGMQEAVRLVSEGKLNPYPLFTHTFPKRQIRQAFEMHQKKPEGFTKALITFE